MVGSAHLVLLGPGERLVGGGAALMALGVALALITCLELVRCQRHDAFPRRVWVRAVLRGGLAAAGLGSVGALVAVSNRSILLLPTLVTCLGLGCSWAMAAILEIPAAGQRYAFPQRVALRVGLAEAGLAILVVVEVTYLGFLPKATTGSLAQVWELTLLAVGRDSMGICLLALAWGASFAFVAHHRAVADYGGPLGAGPLVVLGVCVEAGARGRGARDRVRRLAGGVAPASDPGRRAGLATHAYSTSVTSRVELTSTWNRTVPGP
jgi:hypothetical protein